MGVRYVTGWGRLEALVASALVFSVFSVLWTRAAPFALAFSLFTFLTAGGATAPRARRLAAMATSIVALIGLLRFTAQEALPGIVESGKRASGQRAVSHLRQLWFAEGVMREQAEIDPDNDGVGSAGLIEEVAGRANVRGRFTPLLAPMAMARGATVVRVPGGPCLQLDGYCFLVCVPRLGGGWVSDPQESSKIDEERAERRFVAYAWPAHAEAALSESFFIDEHENILVQRPTPGSAYAGQRSPSCEAALERPAEWARWRNKQPRETLPGAGAR